MPDSIISVQNLSKRYLLGHQGPREKYTALRDVIARNVRGLARTTRDMLIGRQVVEGDEVEEFWALKDVSFEVKRGEVLGIIGRNGAGKSTLLKILSRITEPTKGRIEINGRVASLLEVGTGFHPELTGRENIFLNGAILGMTRSEIRRKFDEIVAFAEVEKFLDTPVKRYSSGMYVRLAFAVAAHLEPEILIVDEVLAVGDAAFQKKCLGKMGEVGKSGRTVLFVSHNMEALLRLCPKALYLVNGELQMIGDTQNVINNYLDNGGLNEGEIDLRNAPRAFEKESGAEFQFLRSIHKNSASGSWCFPYGEPIAFEAEFVVNKTLEDVDFAYQVFSLGVQLISTGTTQEEPIVKLLPGRYKMRVRIPELFLNPNVYTLGLSLVSRSIQIDNIGESAQIEVLASQKSVSKELHRIWAPITPRAEFELRNI
jgi:lipopolysaccharide transport system ATP-binding protein